MPERRLDYTSEAGAQSLARKIEEFWKSAGYAKVAVMPVPMPHVRFGVMWTLQSNIGIDGPPR